MSKKENEKKEAIEILKRDYIKPEDTLLVVIKSVSKSGMYRRMRVLTSDFSDISYYVARAIDSPLNDVGIGIGGGGMDMCFSLIDDLTWALYGKDKPECLKGNGGSTINWRTV